ncbi:FtsK/SpoIIIE domain-containing protein [Amycolatopsis minnesotensis]|uniref:FtsK/SpoIIIE domain-containing protein n=1 Tax=Amycolatopsis minnesotensis TaxID=337894 RepID=A0ABN2RU24_9PSEU
MNVHSPGFLVLLVLALGLVVWVLAKVGRALAAVVETLAFLAFLAVGLWWITRTCLWLLRQVGVHWRTSVVLVAAWAWCSLLGWVSLVCSAASVAFVLVTWRFLDEIRFDHWCGRHLRASWMRWTVYHRKLPGWLRACGLTVSDDVTPIDVTVSFLGRRRLPGRIGRGRTAASSVDSSARVAVPRLLSVRSGASWDEVRLELVPGQTPEDFDDAARALASARKVSRCQVRELAPNVVSVDFQRRDLLAVPVPCPALPELGGSQSHGVDLRRVWSGRTEYGHDWHMPLFGSGAHLLVVGATGSGKNSFMWCPLIAAAPAIRAGNVRLSGIDPKGMELAYGRGIYARYAQSGKDALEVLDSLIDVMEDRKREFAGLLRSVPVSTEHPLELLDFDEIAALTKYTDRKTKEAIVERLSLITTQGRALAVTVRGYVQEPTKDTVPVRELFPRRACLQVTAKSHVGMALGDGAYERGAWANRITDPGVAYVWGEGLREPLRVRAGWVPDDTIKAFENYVTNNGNRVIALSERDTNNNHGHPGGHNERGAA